MINTKTEAVSAAEIPFAYGLTLKDMLSMQSFMDALRTQNAPEPVKELGEKYHHILCAAINARMKDYIEEKMGPDDKSGGWALVDMKSDQEEKVKPAPVRKDLN